MQQICDALKAGVPEILGRWKELLAELPWTSDLSDEGVDHLPEVVIGLVEASLCSPLDEDAHRQKVFAAARHGQDRRDQGWTERQLLQEYHILRQAIWWFLKATGNPRATEVIFRIDTASTLATMASLRGFHRDLLEEQQRWPEALEEIVGDSPFLSQALPER
jgi:hypothetical protein